VYNYYITVIFQILNSITKLFIIHMIQVQLSQKYV